MNGIEVKEVVCCPACGKQLPEYKYPYYYNKNMTIHCPKCKAEFKTLEQKQLVMDV